MDLSEPRALYYASSVGKSRVYRNTYPVPMYKGLKLFAYKKKENAEKLCEEINNVYGDDFYAYEVDNSVVVSINSLFSRKK